MGEIGSNYSSQGVIFIDAILSLTDDLILQSKEEIYSANS